MIAGLLKRGIRRLFDALLDGIVYFVDLLFRVLLKIGWSPKIKVKI